MLFLPRNFGSALASLGDADRYGLLAAGDFFPRATTLEFATFHFVECAVDFCLSLFPVLRHNFRLILDLKISKGNSIRLWGI